MPKLSNSESKYETKDEMGELEGLSERLQSDLRRNIRVIGSFPILSDSWCGMAETLVRIANVSAAEAKLPKVSDSSTLWECEEVALRFVLEDGKLNLCLRNLVEFKEFERSQRELGNSGIRQELMMFMDKFETSLGVILQNAWLHVEAIQTTDLPLLINFCADVLQNCMDHPGFVQERIDLNVLNKKQEVLVMKYIRCIMKQIEEVGEDRIMPLMKERKIFTLILAFLSSWAENMDVENLTVSVEGLALMIESEDFQTFKDSYVSEEDRGFLIDMGEDDNWLEDLVDDDDVRRNSRPLLDLVRESRRMQKDED